MHDKAQASLLMVKINKSTYGIPSSAVIEMGKLPPLTCIAEQEEHIMGIVSLRGHTIPVVNLRVLFGQEPLSAEAERLNTMLVQRESDHVAWLQALEQSLREQVPFTKARDPHQCAFGKWYDNYHTDSLPLQVVLNECDHPHQQIHALATQLLAMMEGGNRVGALERLENARQEELHTLIDLFTKARQLVAGLLRDMMVVVSIRDAWVGLTVDTVEAVEQLTTPLLPMPTAIATPQNAFLTHIFHRTTQDTLGLLLQVDAIPLANV